jgi:hypothetical protein
MTTQETNLTRVGHPQLCYKCDQTTAWAVTTNAKRILMDFHPSPEGRYRIVGTDATGNIIVGMVNRHAAPNTEELHFGCHFSTCPNKRGRGRKTNRYGQTMNLSPFGNW